VNFRTTQYARRWTNPVPTINTAIIVPVQTTCEITPHQLLVNERNSLNLSCEKGNGSIGAGQSSKMRNPYFLYLIFNI
jgi:hypothetical protein